MIKFSIVAKIFSVEPIAGKKKREDAGHKESEEKIENPTEHIWYLLVEW